MDSMASLAAIVDKTQKVASSLRTSICNSESKPDSFMSKPKGRTMTRSSLPICLADRRPSDRLVSFRPQRRAFWRTHRRLLGQLLELFDPRLQLPIHLATKKTNKQASRKRNAYDYNQTNKQTNKSQKPVLRFLSTGRITEDHKLSWHKLGT